MSEVLRYQAFGSNGMMIELAFQGMKGACLREIACAVQHPFQCTVPGPH